MCKWIKDILFPTNVLGKKRKVIPFDTSAIPAMPFKTVTIQWTGERLQVCFTYATYNHYNNQYNYTQEKIDYSGGGTETLSLRDDWSIGKVNNDVVYFNCTNVTSLVVNGQTLI